ncbi:hypothetical protein B0H63DRAFT_556942 [Podospora didyma]|uniref:Ankyrin repeat protein n=1 Tax=Podospora didyma TaxID=330526 RepID=A0AAE0NY81_9PEZI|nr:hypothetical protein B0H63DRAFT_556942 [Podospora didyma]
MDQRFTSQSSTGDVATARRLIECGADPNRNYKPKPRSPRQQRRDMLKAFAVLESGEFEAVMAHIDSRYIRDYPTRLLSALHNCSTFVRPLGSERADTEMVALLLAHGASVHTRSSDRRSVLRMAAEMGRADLANMVLDCGAPVNARDGEGDTAPAVAMARRLLGPLGDDEIGIAKLLCSAAHPCLSPGSLRRRAVLLAAVMVSNLVSSSEPGGGRPSRWIEGINDLHLGGLIPDMQLLEAILERVVDFKGKDAISHMAFEYCAVIGNKLKM